MVIARMVLAAVAVVLSRQNTEPRFFSMSI